MSFAVSRNWGQYTNAQLPNKAGATVQSADLAIGDTAFDTTNGVLVVCTTATVGAAAYYTAQDKKVRVGAAATEVIGFSERLMIAPAVTTTVKAPSGPVIGDSFSVKKTTASLAVVTYDGNGANIEDPFNPGSYAATFVNAIAGISLDYVFDGTNWVNV